jgi:hypothetical protein
MTTAKPASSYPTGIAKPTTPDETQSLSDQPRFHTWYKGNLTGSEIYERLLPDDASGALRIDGPNADNAAIVLDSKGCVKLLTGEKTQESGVGSGKLCIKTWGYQAKHHNRADLEFNSGDDTDENQALNLVCFGDYVEQTIGGTRYIRAQKIVIEASEELLLIGKTQVNIQSGADGGGAIIMNAGSVEKTTSNDKEVILGQKMNFGVSEDTTVTFDPRGSKNVVSTGHINHKVLGDLQTWVGGIESHVVAGGPGTPPLIKARDASFSAKTTGNVDISSTLMTNLNAGGIFNATAGLGMNLTAGGTMNIKGTLILLN